MIKGGKTVCVTNNCSLTSHLCFVTPPEATQTRLLRIKRVRVSLIDPNAIALNRC